MGCAGITGPSSVVVAGACAEGGTTESAGLGEAPAPAKRKDT